MGMGMEQKAIARMAVLPKADELLDVANGLEELAVAFPESRDEVIGLIEQFSSNAKRSEKDLKEAAERIAAIGMLEILCGK
jgi:hypothetical protein